MHGEADQQMAAFLEEEKSQNMCPIADIIPPRFHEHHQECGVQIFAVEILLKVILLNLFPYFHHGVPFSSVPSYHILVHTTPVSVIISMPTEASATNLKQADTNVQYTRLCVKIGLVSLTELAQDSRMPCQPTTHHATFTAPACLGALSTAQELCQHDIPVGYVADMTNL